MLTTHLSVASEVDIGPRNGPNGISAVFLGEDGKPYGRLEAEGIRTRPLRIGFFQTRLARVPALIDCRIELESIKAVEKLVRLLESLGPQGLVRFEDLALIFPKTTLHAAEAEWRAGELVFLGPARINNESMPTAGVMTRLQMTEAGLTLNEAGSQPTTFLLTSNPENP
ncbi:MAG: hypothetical protein ACP5I4_06705 [Oceanipulchritudo sp.]